MRFYQGSYDRFHKSQVGKFATWYLGDAVKGELHSLQHAAGRLLLREEQIPAKAEQSWKLRWSSVSTGRSEDFYCRWHGAAALVLKTEMKTDEAHEREEKRSKKVMAFFITYVYDVSKNVIL